MSYMQLTRRFGANAMEVISTPVPVNPYTFVAFPLEIDHLTCWKPTPDKRLSL